MVGRNEFEELLDRVDNIETFRPQQAINQPVILPEVFDYVSVSYDSVAEEFTVTVTDLPVVDNQPLGNANTRKLWNSNQTVSGTMVFDKPSTGTEYVTLYAGANRVASGGYKIYWDTDPGGATTSDADTTAVYAEGGYGNRFADIGLVSDGTVTFTYQPEFEGYVGISRMSFTPHLWISKGDTTIRLNWTIDPFDNDTVAYTMAYTAPFDDDVILGFTNNSVTLTLDSLANSGSYNEYIRVGEVKISSGGDVQKCHLLPAPLAAIYGLSLGFTGTGSYTTLRIVNGRIVNAT